MKSAISRTKVGTIVPDAGVQPWWEPSLPHTTSNLPLTLACSTSVAPQLPRSTHDMNQCETIDEYLTTFMEEINGLNDDALQPPQALPAPAKKRRRTQTKPNTEKPGWVPKPPDDCPIVSWLENGNLYAVQNPTNKGPILLKMEMYDGSELTYRCGLFLNKNSEIHKCVNQVVDRVENMWIDKKTGVPKIIGLTQTVTQNSSADVTVTKKKGIKGRAQTSKKRGKTAN